MVQLFVLWELFSDGFPAQFTQLVAKVEGKDGTDVGVGLDGVVESGMGLPSPCVSCNSAPSPALSPGFDQHQIDLGNACRFVGPACTAKALHTAVHTSGLTPIHFARNSTFFVPTVGRIQARAKARKWRKSPSTKKTTHERNRWTRQRMSSGSRVPMPR